jgi:opacity protein-like surface antigen
MRRLFLMVLLLALAAAVAVQAEGKFSFGLWEGQRDVGYLYYSYFHSTETSALEGGAYLHWDVADNLGLRFQAAYLKGSSHSSSTNAGPLYISESKFELTGFPVQFAVLPTARVGDRLILRTGGGLSYYKLTGKGSFTSTGYPTSTLPQHGVTGFGGQLLLTAEGKLNKNIGLEAQYEKGTAKLNYTVNWTDPWGGTTPTTHKESFGTATEAYRLGLAVHF